MKINKENQVFLFWQFCSSLNRILWSLNFRFQSGTNERNKWKGFFLLDMTPRHWHLGVLHNKQQCLHKKHWHLTPDPRNRVLNRLGDMTSARPRRCDASVKRLSRVVCEVWVLQWWVPEIVYSPSSFLKKEEKRKKDEKGSTMWGHWIRFLPHESGGSGVFGVGSPP